MLSKEDVDNLLGQMEQNCGCPIKVQDRLSAYTHGLVAALKFLAPLVSIDAESAQS